MNKLSFKQFISKPVTELYEIYSKLYDDLNGNDEVFTQVEEPKDTLSFFNNQRRRYTSKTNDSMSWFLKKTRESHKKEERIRTHFRAKPIYEGVDTLFIGGSILRKVGPFQVDKNMQVHSFSGWTTKEKILCFESISRAEA